MAWTFIANRGTNTSKSSGTTLDVNPTATIGTGRILIVRCASDDLTGSGPTHVVSDDAGNSYEQLAFYSASSDAGSSVVSIHAARVTTQLTTGNKVTLTLGASRVAKAIALTEFSVATGYTYQLASQNTAAGSSTSPSVTISGLSSLARLWAGAVGVEGPSGDSFTNDTDYSNPTSAGTTGNPVAGNITLRASNRIATLTGDTFNPTITSRDWTTALVALNETTIPAAQFAANISATATAAATLTASITAACAATATASLAADGTLSIPQLEGTALGMATTAARLTLPQEESYGSWSDYLENECVKHFFRTGSFTKPTELWISLHTEDLQDDGSGAEVSGGSYARVELDPGDSNWAAVGADGTNALTYNLVPIVFPGPTADWGHITHMGIWDAETEGNLLFHSVVDPAVTISSGEAAPQINVGDLQVNINVPPLFEYISLNASITCTATAEGNIEPVLFQSGFEDAAIVPPWDSRWTDADVTINTNPTYVKSGSQSLQIYYYVVGSDCNRYVTKYFNAATGYPDGLKHFFIRGYFYQKTPEAGGSKDIQRKLFYLMSPPGPTHPVYQYAALVNSFTTSETGHLMHLCVDVADDIPGDPDHHYYPSPDIYLNFDQWYCIEFEVQVNTPGEYSGGPYPAPYYSDGIERLWLDGDLVFEKTDCCWVSDPTFTSGITIFQVGDQTSEPVVTTSEYRYWDDVAISMSYIGT